MSGAQTDEPEDVDEQLLGGYTGRLLLVTSIGWMMIQAGRLVVSPMLPSIISELDITPFLAGIGFSVMWGLYALNQYPSGRLSDRLSRKTLLVVGLAFLIVGFGLFVVATTYPIYLLACTIVGFGAGLFPTPARALLSDHFVEKRGRAFGIHTGLGDMGGLVASALEVGALAVSTWHAAFVPIAVSLAVVLLVLHRLGREPYTRMDVDTETARSAVTRGAGTVRRLTSEWQLRLILFAYALFAFAWQSSAGFLPIFLQEAKGFSPGLASAGFALMFVTGGIVKPISGSLGDSFDKVLVAIAALLLGAVSLAFTVFAPSKPLTILGVVGFAIGLLAYPPVVQAYLMDAFPNASMGGDLGAIRTIYILIGALGPSYTGFVAAQTNYSVAFLGLVCCLLVGAMLVAVSTQFRG